MGKPESCKAEKNNKHESRKVDTFKARKLERRKIGNQKTRK